MNLLLTDSACMNALDAAKIAVKQHFGYAKNERFVATALTTGVIDWCVAVADEQGGKLNSLTLKEYVTQIENIKRSVTRHSQDGDRRYFAFIKKYVP
jgi:hypothetical protein